MKNLSLYPLFMHSQRKLLVNKSSAPSASLSELCSPCPPSLPLFGVALCGSEGRSCRRALMQPLKKDAELLSGFFGLSPHVGRCLLWAASPSVMWLLDWILSINTAVVKLASGLTCTWVVSLHAKGYKINVLGCCYDGSCSVCVN